MQSRHIVIEISCRIALKSMECYVVPRGSRIFNCTREYRVRIHPDILSPYRAILAHMQGKCNPSIGKFIFIYSTAADFAPTVREISIEIITVENYALKFAAIANIHHKVIPQLAIDLTRIVAVLNTEFFLHPQSIRQLCLRN